MKLLGCRLVLGSNRVKFLESYSLMVRFSFACFERSEIRNSVSSKNIAAATVTGYRQHIELVRNTVMSSKSFTRLFKAESHDRSVYTPVASSENGSKQHKPTVLEDESHSHQRSLRFSILIFALSCISFITSLWIFLDARVNIVNDFNCMKRMTAPSMPLWFPS